MSRHRHLYALALLPLLLSASGVRQADQPRAGAEWRFYGGDQGNTRFSTLRQIDGGNVGKLHVAWRYHAGGSDTELRTAMECTPLVIGEVMYVTSPVLEVIALDAATGRQIWRYNPFPEEPSYRRLWVAAAGGALFLIVVAIFARRLRKRASNRAGVLQFTALLFVASAGSDPGLTHRGLVQRIVHRLLPDPRLEQRHSGPNRGLTYWEDGTDRRIFFAGGHRLVALDAQSGRPVANFGKQGVVDLLTQLAEPGSRSLKGLSYAVTSPGVICGDLLILGSAVGEGPDSSAPGDVQAFDVRTGLRRWVFHTIPRPGTAGAETWPRQAYRRTGGVNSWAGMSVDEKLGLVFVPTGSAAFDYYGGDRAGQNLYSDSLVALRARDGQPQWHFQAVHHDLWDDDLPCPPVLATIQHTGKPVKAVVQPTKQGFLFVLDRQTGKPFFPVEERPVPASIMPGEKTWPTQPVPLKPAPLVRQAITEADLTDLSPHAHAYALAEFRALDGSSLFLPPTRRGTLVVPGFQGGVGWGGASFNPETGRLVVNTNEIPYRLRMVASHRHDYPYTVENFDDPFVDEEGFPAIRPPWGKLSALDLSTGEAAWQVPFGEYPALTARGLPVTGTDNIGGSLQTGSGLIFIAATKDRRFRAFDAASGRVLWSAALPAAGHASPATYSVRGKQYVVIAAGGGSIAESSPSGDEYIAYSLPDVH